MSEGAQKIDGELPPLALQPGTKVGSYTLGKLIAEGGMGAVYEATHSVTKQRRALKVVRPELSRNEDFRERFVREVTIASSVKHPNLVDTQDPIEADGFLVLPMELLEGETLSARLKRGKLTASEMVELVVPLCLAVHAVHEHKVIHRDLKPLNVFLATSTGGKVTPKVLDFGAAREVDDTEHTRTGLIIGSPFYMAPEQAEALKDLDARTDVYSLGVIAYHCLTGRRPYESESAQSAMVKLIRRETFEPPNKLEAKVPAAVAAVVMKALAYDRTQRHASMAEFASALTSSIRPHLGGAPSAGAEPSESTLLTESSGGGTMQLDAADLAVVADSGVRAAEPKPPATAGFAAPPDRDASGEARATGGVSRRVAVGIAAAVIVVACAIGWRIVTQPGATDEPLSSPHGLEPAPPAPRIAAPPPTPVAAEPLPPPVVDRPRPVGPALPATPPRTPPPAPATGTRRRRETTPDEAEPSTHRTPDDDSELPLF
jgi:tRNA A-37 threonylcarbamoyl transferase component Bud32